MATNGAQVESAEESDEFTISNRDVIRLHWKVIALLATAIVFVASYSITSVINSPHRRIDQLAKDIVEHHEVLDELNENILNIKNDDNNCITRQMEMELRMDKQEEIHLKLHNKVYEFQAKKNAVDDHQDALIRHFMRIPD